jgi:hypothetical protein
MLSSTCAKEPRTQTERKRTDGSLPCLRVLTLVSARRGLRSVAVIVNPVCPGLVHSDIGRSITKVSTLMRLVLPVYLGALSKSTDYGARFYVTAACTSAEQHVR